MLKKLHKIHVISRNTYQNSLSTLIRGDSEENAFDTSLLTSLRNSWYVLMKNIGCYFETYK